MDGLAAFLTARLDEDETAARAAADAAEAVDWMPSGRAPDAAYSAFREHIARHDPARALREVEAKRAILGMHHPAEPHPESGFTYPAAAKFCGWCGPGDNWQAEQEPGMFSFAVWPCRHVRILAAVYSDHPDYRAEWKP